MNQPVPMAISPAIQLGSGLNPRRRITTESVVDAALGHRRPKKTMPAFRNPTFRTKVRKILFVADRMAGLQFDFSKPSANPAIYVPQAVFCLATIWIFNRPHDHHSADFAATSRLAAGV